MQLPENILDKNTGEYIDIKDFNLYFEAYMSRWDSNRVRDAMLEFVVVEDVGRVTQTVNLFVFTYLEFESIKIKNLRFGLIPTTSGKFSGGVEFPMEFYEKEHVAPQDPERFRLTNSPCDQFMTSYSGVRINDGAINYLFDRWYM